jgi:hypothetical protein
MPNGLSDAFIGEQTRGKWGMMDESVKITAFLMGQHDRNFQLPNTRTMSNNQPINGSLPFNQGFKQIRMSGWS